MAEIVLATILFLSTLTSVVIVVRLARDARTERARQRARATDLEHRVRVTEVRHALEAAGLNARQALIRAALEAVREEERNSGAN